MKLHFTKRAIEAIAAQDRQLTYTDQTARGLTLIVFRSGVKTFYLTRKFRGRVTRTLLGRFPELPLAAARKKAAYLQVQYDSGIDPTEAKRQARKELSLDEFFEHYYQDHCLRKNRRPEVAKANYRRYLKPTLGRLQLSRIHRDDIKTIMRRLADRGLTRTANTTHTLLRAMLNKALAWDYLTTGKNPAQHIERYPEVVRTRVLLTDELPRFHQALALDPSDLNRDAILLLLFTGARSHNVLSMRWQELDLEQRVWTIPQTKNGSPQRVVLSPQAITVLNRRKRNRLSVFVLPGNGRSGHIQNINKAWHRLLDRAGIDGLIIHDLRRTLGTQLANLGANQAQIQMHLGHKDPQSARAYIHPDLEYLRPKVEQATKLLAGD